MAEATADAVAVAADEASSNASTITTLEALQKQTSHPRRMRPPDVLREAAATDEPRIPLRQEPRDVPRPDPEKLAHRESRIGLRGMFSRNKAAGKDARASIVDFSSWPSFHSPRPDSAGLARHASALSSPSLPSIPQEQQVPPEKQTKPAASASAAAAPTSAPAPAAQPAEPSLLGMPSTTTRAKKPAAALRSRGPGGSSTRAVRGSLATWDPPPLFQAYPQAIKHAQLPLCTTSIDVLLRLQAASSHGAGADPLGDGPDDHLSVAENPADKPADKSADKTKRRHRHNTSAASIKLDWVSKIYVLVTSGYLLQYAAEGSFDRLPEKILPISCDSAAFASDLIPGRHWVLRVCASMGADGLPTNDSRSLFSRLPFRGSERRHASTFLLVFDGAEEMESWITILRREIEQLGGKKRLSETGKPKIEHSAVHPPVQVNQRTPVVRNPGRFSRLFNPNDVAHSIRHPHAAQLSQHSHNSQHLETPMSAHEREPMSDDVSTTNSVYSQDGRQLENLRDTAGNRLSYISTGQRTVVTSDSSSPPCSPVRDSFTSPSPSDDQQTLKEAAATTAAVATIAAAATVTTMTPATPSTPTTPASSPQAESPGHRPRPNAAAILERRQSLQTLTTATRRMSDMHFLPTQLPAQLPAQLPPQQPPPSEALPRLPVSSFSITSPISKPLPPPVPLRRETNYSLFDEAPTIPNFSVPNRASKRYSAVLAAPMTVPAPVPAPTAAAPALASALATAPPLEQPPAAYSAFPQPPRMPQSLIPPSRRNSSRRRLPPPSLAFSRPLSVVADHASPSTTSPPPDSETGVSDASVDDSNVSSPGYGSDVPDTPSLFSSWQSPTDTDTNPTTASSISSQPDSLSYPGEDKLSGGSTSIRRQPMPEAPIRLSPRRHSSLLTLRSAESVSMHTEARNVVVSHRASTILPMSKYSALPSRLLDEEQEAQASQPRSAQPPHQPCASSLTRPLPAARTLPPASNNDNSSRSPRLAEPKRASMFVQPSSTSRGPAPMTIVPSSRPLSVYQTATLSRVTSVADTGRGRVPLKAELQVPLAAAPLAVQSTNMANVPHVPNMRGRARSTSSGKAVPYCRSMPQLAERSPPPVPPPTCALPPPPPPPTCALPPAPPPTCALPPLPSKPAEHDPQHALQI